MLAKIKSTFLIIKDWILKQLKKISPGDHAFKGAGIGLIFGSMIFFLIETVGMVLNFRDPWILLLGLVIILAATLAAFLSNWLLNKWNELPRLFKIGLFIAAPLLLVTRLGDERVLLFLILVFALLGAGLASLKKGYFPKLSTPKKVVVFLGTIVGLAGAIAFIYFLSIRGLEMKPIINVGKLAEENISVIEAPSPAEKGKYGINYFTYGSGKDIRREEFAEGVSYQTESVDGTAFLDNWEGISGKYRTHYWGFDFKELPLNGRVWMPEGDGPFPLVLVVHGNHPMQDFSDPGYDYLGELLASRGFILVSVDENFLNGSWSDFPKGLDKENDARGWILLEHLRQWKDWSTNPQHELYQKVDLDKLALIGHSRGGEAVGHAAMLNQLDYYPDDASIKFDYHFNIQSIVAIAPVDGQYKPGSSLTKFENVSYLGIHGAQDADVESFDGAKQYERIAFTDSAYRFKAGIYISGANHGQFNSSWGDNDILATFSGILNKKQLMDVEDQERVAEVFISAFLETTLNQKMEYLPLFADARKGRNWLPESIYLSQFEDSRSRFWAGYDEDFEVKTLTKGRQAVGKNLSVWREGEVIPKYGLKGTRAVFLGWNYEEFGGDTLDWEGLEKPKLPDSVLSVYSMILDQNSFRPDSSSVLIFSLAESDESSNPKSSGKWVKNESNNENQNTEENSEETDLEDEEEEEEEKDDEKPLQPLDFSIELIDSEGEKIRFLLSDYSPLQRLIKSRVLKIQFLDKEDETESIFQFYQFDLNKYALKNPFFDPSKLQEIHFIFDQSEAGVVVLDQVGLMPRLDN